MDTRGTERLRLSDIPLFSGVAAADLAALSQRALVRAYPKNAIIVSEGDRSDSMFIILAGKVKVFLGDAEGKELILDIKGPGSYFGEMVLDDGTRSASVMTLEPSQFAILACTDIKGLLAEHPGIALQLIRNLIRMVRGLNENVRSLAMLDVYGRVARVLLELAAPDGADKLVIADKPTQRDLAARVGASREMINRILRDLSAGGYITVESARIVINKPPPARW
ncbi:MAG TPA: Crp/Fnr family transcriptional regulator [Burkholderiales bacterium]|nr:Crp/Fnr family transcriptional regulator [Burkholderiales bacterium]